MILGVTGPANYSDEYLEKDLLKIVSDEDTAIIGAVKLVFPDVAHSFSGISSIEESY